MMPAVKGSKTRKRVARQRGKVTVCGEDRRDQPYSPGTISVLPDDILLELFKFYVDQGCLEDGWHTLIHVCRRWRSVVLDSPRSLHLQLHCTNRSPAKRMLDVWPTLPIAIDAFFTNSRRSGVNNVVAALEEHDRVSRINIWGVPSSLLKNGAMSKKPFPALTDLTLRSYRESHDAPLIPASFLGRSTPRLQSLELSGVQFPALGKLLSSATRLVTLRLSDIPNPGDILPDAMAACLSALATLQELFLDFRFPRSVDDRRNRNPSLPPPRRFVLPSLTEFYFKGDDEYLEDLVDRIDTPALDKFTITFFDQLLRVSDTPLLRDFFARTNAFRALHRAAIFICSSCINLTLFRRKGTTTSADHGALDVGISCCMPDRQLLSLAQFCRMSLPLPHLTTLERLGIHELMSLGPEWMGDMENAPWLELLRSFVAVKDLALSRFMVRKVAPALRELTGEGVTEVLPALRHVFVDGFNTSGRTQDVIEQFVTARQLSGHPVTVHRVAKGS